MLTFAHNKNSRNSKECSSTFSKASSPGSRTVLGKPNPIAPELFPKPQNERRIRTRPIPENTDPIAANRKKELADRVKSQTQIYELFDQPGWKVHIHDLKFVIECLTVIIRVICAHYNSLIKNSGHNPRTDANLFLLTIEEYFLEKYGTNQSGAQTDAP